MPRPVQIRPNFTRDSQYLMRLKAAIEKDSRPPEWKRRVIEQIDALVVTLIQAPALETPRLLKPKRKKAE